ncbi:MAG TPA: hypothetical protein VFK14_11945 [Solirubrobacterales bacterium]|nr:hypothetical protein [Solirubrobacterales bacterium]
MHPEAALRRRWHWLIPGGVIFCFLAPILFTDRTFASDWGNHYWLIHMQGLNIRSLGAPSIYLQSSLGAFYPYYAFYGGTFYALAGFLADVFDAEFAVLLVTAGAIAANYLGWTWMAMQAGVRGWRVQLPGLIAVTAPLAVSNVYGRGGIPELVATAMLPLVAAAGISLVRERRLRLRDGVAFFAGVVFLTGSHVLTMVWGTIVLGLLAVVLVACHWPLAKQRSARFLRLAWLGALAACINAWVLGPLLLFHSRTVENEPDPIAQQAYTSGGNLFRILRDTPQLPYVTGDVNAALPVLALLWALACGIVFWRLLAPRSRALAIGLTAVLGLLVLLILDWRLISDLPEFLRYIQFPYRLVTYADFCVAGLVTLVLAGLERRRSSAGSFAAVAVLAVIAAFSFAISIQQNFDVRSWLGGRGEVLASSPQPPPSWYAMIQFGDGESEVVAPTLPRPLTVPVEEGIRGSYRVEYPPGPAGTVQTNVNTGPYLVDVSGATPAGRNEAGQMVLRLPGSPRRPRVVTVSGKESAAVVVSRWISLAALALSLLALVAAIVRRSRRGRSGAANTLAR